MPETPEEPAYPGIYDLVEHSSAPRWLLRYAVPRDYTASIKRWRRFGGRAMQRIVMRHSSREKKPFYYLDYKGHNRLTQAAQHISDETLVSEFIHGPAAAFITTAAGIGAVALGDTGLDVFAGVACATSYVANAFLVATQRYNRARMMLLADRRLQQGETFAPDYTNILGIDAEAYRRFQQAQLPPPAQPMPELP